jgi:hypothetical protein
MRPNANIQIAKLQNRTPILFLNFFIALVWLINGLFYKLLNLMPRHQLIVSGILGNDHAREITMLIGIAEVMMAVWILTRKLPVVCAWVQLFVIGTMNTIEFLKVPELLMFGKMNAVFALVLMLLVYWNGKLQMSQNSTLV